ncbi:hypothetical protein C7N43_09430 [Sphingobacteriales bacterium UPWRP_1]|nr:hypothetical protein C7N43_09430 [Sphingobacteriales bacterium UPWRP_1]
MANQAPAFIQTCLYNKETNVNTLATHVAMSRILFYKKGKTLPLPGRYIMRGCKKLIGCCMNIRSKKQLGLFKLSGGAM